MVKKFEHTFIRLDMIHEREKIAVFTYRSPHFCFPWRHPCDYHAICCMDGNTIQCLPNPSQYVPIFNSFRVIRCWSQCVSARIAIFFHIFVSPGDAPGAITLNLYGWKENSMLTNCLAACTHLSSTVCQLFEPQVPKIAVFTHRSPHFCFPCRRPCDYHDICCMDGKTIQWLPNPSQHVPIFNSFRVIRCLSQCISPKIAIFTTLLFPLGTPLGQSR